jgi:hypothetical protein
MKQPNENLTAQFEKNAQPTPPAEPSKFERLATHGRGIPRQGYVAAFDQMTSAGKAQIAADAATRGIKVFPPAEKMLDGNK